MICKQRLITLTASPACNAHARNTTFTFLVIVPVTATQEACEHAGDFRRAFHDIRAATHAAPHDDAISRLRQHYAPQAPPLRYC